MKKIKTFLSSILILGVLFSVITPAVDASAKMVQRVSYSKNTSSSFTSHKNQNNFDISNIKKIASSVDRKKLKSASEMIEDIECLTVHKQLKNFSNKGMSFSKNTNLLSMKDKKIVSDSKIGKDSETQNNPPIADLKYVILNPDSLINGNVTTKTQIGWLWSYNGQNFTYDPDGDAIVKKNIGGISNDSIIGTFKDGSGFVTQFTIAAQYIMTFQVEDARGALSNMFSIAISVEPADGNTRPVCNIQYSIFIR